MIHHSVGNSLAGKVVYVVHLHLNTAQEVGPHPERDDERIYSVDGKARPMLFITRESKKDRGVYWYLAFPIFSDGHDERGVLKKDFMEIGDCLETSHRSFIHCSLGRIPENLIVTRGDQPKIIEPSDPQAIANFLKIITMKRLGYA